MDNKENNFLDSRTVIAIVLVGVIWFGWQTYLSKKYPQMGKPAVVADTTAPVEGKTNAMAPPAAGPESSIETAKISENLLPMDSTDARFKISSRGFGLREMQLKNFTNRDKSEIQFAGGLETGLFSLSLLGQKEPLDFNIKSVGENAYEGTAHAGGATIVRRMTYDPATFSFQNEITISHVTAALGGVVLALPEKKEEYKKGSFLMGNYEHQEFYVGHEGSKTDRVNVSSAKEKIDQTFNDVSVVSIGSQYFATAIVDKSEIIPTVELKADPATTDFRANLVYKTSSAKDQIKLSFKTFAGPKERDILVKVDPELTDIVNLGYFSGIGKILLMALKTFHGFLGNWGVSIIFLTLVVRLLVLPVNIASYRSMKRMQKIQPLMKSVREKFKDDPASLNRETMALMKREKVNPLGGCLPMLLQMPIFFALFSVLGHSIDLYQAPFFGWISDLSLKDPYYILPILVGIIFFVQQKITPTTMDPAQAKVMQFMPILFSVMMVSLPSGLNLYTFVSTLFGVTQQRIFMRDRKQAATAQVSKA